jgi:hypothetical protein
MNEDDVEKEPGGAEQDLSLGSEGVNDEGEVIASPRSLHSPHTPFVHLL